MKQTLTIVIIVSLFVMMGCNEKSNNKQEVTPRGNPVLCCEVPIEDQVNHTFSLTLRADSAANASVIFYLIDCGDTLMTENGQNVTFANIAPLDDGYDVAMRVEWSDTIIVLCRHVTGFKLTPEPVEPMTAEELQKLINVKDKSIRRGSNQKIAQSMKLVVKESLRAPRKLSEVIDCIELGEWKSVIVIHVDYDDNNLITSVTLNPVGEKPLPVEDPDNEFVVYDD